MLSSALKVLGFVALAFLCLIALKMFSSVYAPGRMSESYVNSSTTGVRARGMDFSPDGRHLAVGLCDRTCWIRIYDLQTHLSWNITGLVTSGQPRSGSENPAAFSNPTFHPDGKRLAFVQYEPSFKAGSGPRWKVVLTDYQGGMGREEVLSSAGFIGNLGFIDGGREFAFVGRIADESKPHDGRVPYILFRASTTGSAPVRALASHDAWQFKFLKFVEPSGAYLFGYSVRGLDIQKGAVLYWDIKADSLKLIRADDGYSSMNWPLRDGFVHVRRSEEADGVPAQKFIYDVYREQSGKDKRLTHGLGHVRGLVVSPDESLIATIVVRHGERHETVLVLKSTGETVFSEKP